MYWYGIGIMATTPDIDDSNWRDEYKNYTTNKLHLELLENGAKSLSQSWILNALYQKWRKMKGYVTPEPPDCRSSLKEFNERVKQQYIKE
tara:strand:+ start:108 stop:377 length:270 start_codon:yes stop_codon:yes gene_type:complete